jgi:cell division inhibitor SulA
MANSSYYRKRAEQALRLARQSTDPMWIETLTETAQEHLARADAIDGPAVGKDPRMRVALP